MKNTVAWIIVIVCGLFAILIALVCWHNIKIEEFPISTYAPNESIIQQEPLKILFLGDMMLDRTLRKRGEVKGYPFLFECMKETFLKYDEVVVNLEGTVTDYESVSRSASFESPESFRFTFDPVALDAAAESGITVFGLANNHIYDYGKDGVVETIYNLTKRNLHFFGNTFEDKMADDSLTLRKGEQTLVIIPFNEFFGNKDIKKEETVVDIQMAKKENPRATIVVFAHWGDEYIPASERVKNWAHEFVDAGADIIIGMHPHIIQEKEIYKDAYIYYSLGNFIFDQYWEESVRTGLAVGVVIDAKKPIVFSEIMLEIDRSGQTCPQKEVVI